MNQSSVVDPCRCPLCGGPNQCAMTQPEPAAHTPCWCTREQFSAQLLQQVPEAARAQACICPDCVKASQVQA